MSIMIMMMMMVMMIKAFDDDDDDDDDDFDDDDDDDRADGENVKKVSAGSRKKNTRPDLDETRLGDTKL